MRRVLPIVLVATLMFGLFVAAAKASCSASDRPPAPSNVRGLALSPTEIALTWNNNINKNTTSYFDVLVLGPDQKSAVKSLTGVGQHVEPGSSGFFSLTGLPPPAANDFVTIRARTEAGTEGCISVPAPAPVKVVTYNGPPLTRLVPVGDSGDKGFISLCAPGSYMVGAHIRSGLWMDQISVKCAPVNNGTTGSPVTMEPHGKNGGGAHPDSADTCSSGAVVSGIDAAFTPNNRQVRLINFDCLTIQGGQTVPTIKDATFMHQHCPTGQWAFGLQGNEGDHVNAIGLICAPSPQAIPVPVPPSGNSGGPQPSANNCPGLSGDLLAVCTETNNKRALHGVPPVTWSATLATNAANWVNGCHTALDSNGNPYFCHQQDCGGGDKYGENLEYSQGTPIPDGTAVVDSWYCEISYYNFSNPVLKTGSMNGCGKDAQGNELNPNGVNAHFTEVVWKSVTQLGCAENTCQLNGVPTRLWACEYNPPGNFNANNPGVLQQNVPPLVMKGFAQMHTKSFTPVARGTSRIFVR